MFRRLQSQRLHFAASRLPTVTILQRRGVRQLPNSRRPTRSKDEDTPKTPETIMANPVLHDVIDPKVKATKSEIDSEVDANPDSILLDSLNRARPGTQTDLRYRSQKKVLRHLKSPEAKLKSISNFLLNEIKHDLINSPNPDELDDGSNLELEQFFDFSVRRDLLQNTSTDSPENSSLIVKFRSLLAILESLMAIKGGVLKLSPEFYVEVFQISQYIDQENLKLKGRYISGSLIYRLKKFELDILSESQYIEALIQFGEHREADKLLKKRCEKVNQRWWYELIIVNNIEIGNLNEAEKYTDVIKTKFEDDYLDSRVFLLLINRYILSANVERANYWTKRYQDAIVKLGFAQDSDEVNSPGVDSTEEEALTYLNRKENPRKEDFLGIIDSYLENETFYKQSEELIKFYLDQPTTSGEELYPLLLNFKLEYNFKIKPILLNLANKKDKQIQLLINFFEDYRINNPIESQQSDFVTEYLSALSKHGGLKQLIIKIRENFKENSRLDSETMFKLLEGLMSTNKVNRALEFLSKMEESLEIERSDSDEKIQQLILPAVETKHYLPFLRKFGTTGDFNQFSDMLIRYNNTIGVYNPPLLLRIIVSCNKMRQYGVSLQYINEILINDLHKQDPSFTTTDYTRLYSGIWSCLKDIIRDLSKTSSPTKKLQDLAGKFPNLRFVFMKMIHDKVIPRPKDYFNIISTFLYNNDMESVVCVLQYLGKNHKLIPDEQTLRILDRYTINYKLVPKGQELLLNYTLHEKELKRLNLKGHSTNSLDPIQSMFAKDNGETKEYIIDLETQEQSSTQNLIWRLELYKLVNFMKEMKYYRESSLREVHNSFELPYEIDHLIKPIEDIKKING